MLDAAFANNPPPSEVKEQGDNKPEKRKPVDVFDEYRMELEEWSAWCPELQLPGRIDELVEDFRKKKEAESHGDS